jgi:DNA-binding beta-propeller fold protein YncE
MPRKRHQSFSTRAGSLSGAVAVIASTRFVARIMWPRFRRYANNLAIKSVFALIVTAVGAGASGCSTSTEPPFIAGEAVLTTNGTRDQLLMIAPGSGAVASKLNLGGKVEGATASSDGSALYLGIAGSGFKNELIHVDTRRNSVLCRLPLGINGQPTVVDGVGLISGEELAVSPDERRLYLWRATKNGIAGVTVIDLETRRPTAFNGPWNISAGGLVPLPPGLEFAGALAIVGSRQNAAGGPLVQSSIFLLHPTSLQVMDSILASDLGGDPDEDIWGIFPAPDGETLYVAESKRLIRYSLSERKTIASIERPSSGAMSLTRASDMVVLTDVGTWPDSPGSGVVYLYGPTSNLGVRSTSARLSVERRQVRRRR